jgi:hypothetical protein
LLLRNFVIRNFVIRNFVIRNFVIRNFVPVPKDSLAKIVRENREATGRPEGSEV